MKKGIEVAIIGGGLGGLACGAFLAKQGMKVAVFEQHYIPGGYCHSFRRGPYLFDAAVEYIGCCGEGQDVWRLLQQLGGEKFVKFNEMNPDAFDRLYFPRHKVAICKDFNTYLNRLAELFPRDRKGLFEYGEVLSKIWKEIHVWGVGLFLWRFKRFPSACPTMQRCTGKTLADLFESTIRSGPLRAILAGQCGNYGLSSSKVDLITHAITVMNFHEGAYYPRGGAQEFTNALVKALELQGGKLFLRRAVSQIVIRNKKARGLKFDNGEYIAARTIVSSLDPRATLLNLPSERLQLGRLGQRLRATEFSLASFQVYLGVRMNDASLGLGDSNHWVSPTYDLDGLYARLTKGQCPSRTYFMVSSASLKDRSGKLAPPGEHVVKILTPVSWRCFTNWEKSKLGRRGDIYKSFKDRLASSLINQASEVIPGLNKNIQCLVTGSPLTNQFYTRAPEGAMYGVSRVPNQSGPNGFSTQTPIQNLYLTGTNVYYPGVVGALGAGVMTGVVVLRDQAKWTRSNEN